MTRKVLLIVALTAAVFLAAACSDDDECVNCPEVGLPKISMANIWPHLDGTVWTFGMEYRELDFPPSTEVKSGKVPSMETLHEWLSEPMEGMVLNEAHLTYEFALNGMITTGFGIQAQRVIENFYPELPGSDAGSSPQGGDDRLLALIAQARPDLREEISSRYGLDEKALEARYNLLFLGGYAFAYEDSGYYSYGEVDRRHSRIYLEGDLSVGSEFSMQLAPSLDNDIWLHGKIWSVGRRTVNGTVYPRVLECMYVLDFGETYYRTAYGGSYGPYYPYYYGHSFFVPGVGPVAGIERRVHHDDEALSEDWPPMAEFVVELENLSLPD